MDSAPASSHTGRAPDPECRFGHRRRIRGTTYIWGSHGIAKDLTFPSPLVLYLRNDAFGETITIRTEKANGTTAVIGTLEAGDYLSLPIQDIRGVSVTCDLESTVTYALSGDPGEAYALTLAADRALCRPRPAEF